MRIPLGGGRVELRAADSANNPYLGAAMVLSAGLEGIREGLDPGEPHTENMYRKSDAELKEMGIRVLPRNLEEAVDAFEADPLSAEVMGQAMFESYARFRRQEWEAYHNFVSTGSATATSSFSDAPVKAPIVRQFAAPLGRVSTPYPGPLWATA